MNNIYKVIWSKAKNCYVVASEIARSHTKSASGSEKIGGVARHALLALGVACAIACGGFVNVGAAVQRETISPTGTTSNPVLTASNLDDDAHLNTVISVVREDKLVTKDNIAGQLTDYAKASDLSAKADANDVYSKTDAENTFATKTELGSYAIRTELDAKANTDLSNLTADGETKIKNIMSADMEKKANKDTVTALGERVGGVEGKVTALENTVGNDSRGLVKDVNDFKNQVNTELGTKAKQSDLEDATKRITVNEGNITALQTKTQKIDYDAANGITSVNGMKVGQQVDMNGKNLTDVGTINGIDLGTKQKGNYISQDGSIWGNMMEVDTQAKTNADNIQTNANNIKSNKDEIARVNGELVKTNDYFNSELGKTNDYFNKELSKTNNHFNTELGKTNAALQATNKRTAGIGRTDTGVEANNQTVIEDKVHFDQNGNVSGVKDLNTDTIHATGEITSKGLNAGDGDIKTSGTVSAGNVSTGTLETTGDATIGRNLDVKGTLNIKDVTAETIHISKSEDNTVYKSEGKIIGEGGKLSVSNEKFDKRTNITEKSELNVNEKGTVNWATSTDNTTGNVTEGRAEVTADNIKNSVKKTEGGKTFGYEENITADGKVGTVTDKEGNTSTTRQDSKGVYGYAKDKDGNKSYTKQEGNRIAESVIGQDGKQTKSEMTSTDITNTAKDGTITNTAKNVTNEGTESVTNKVGANEVKVSTNGVDITAEAGKKITESVGTASRVVENDKITDKAADSTVTTENGKGTTFGKEGSTGTTNIYGDSIKTGTINAEDTTTAKLTAGAAAGADGGRLTVDANDGVKGSYKSGDYTSRSYILANTLKSGVDNGKEPTDADFMGSRTDHYMDGDKAKLDETVKDAAGSNVTNKTSTGTVTTITGGTTTTKTEQGVKDITNTAKNGTITNDAKDIVNIAKDTITNTAGTSITNQVNDSKVTTDANGTTFENNTPAVSDGGATTTQINGNQITTGRVDANELGVSDKDDQGNTADFSVKAGEGIKGSATDKDGNKTYTKVTATENSFQVQDKDGNIKNHQVNTKDKSENTIKNGDKTNTVTSTADGTTFKNSKANTAFEGGTYTDTTINGNTITTGQVTMDYAEVMKDLGVHGSAKVDNNLEVGGTTTTKTLKVTENATVGGTLDVTQKATFHDDVDIKKNLSVDGNATIKGDVTASSYKVGDKTYISAAGINANNQKITNVADGSISEGSKDAVNGGQLYDVKRDMEHKVDKVGANAAAMANLHPMEFDPDSKWNIAAAIGNYGSETAAALGAFYRPNDDVMVNLSTAFGTGENMVGGGVSVRLGKGGNKLSREETNALKAQVADLTARMDALLSVLNPNMSKDFPDVPENHWAYEAVSRLAGNDIVQGYPDGEFHGERTMTRYEMAEIIYNALSRGAEAEKELVEEFKPELQAMAASEKATAEKAEG